MVAAVSFEEVEAAFASGPFETEWLHQEFNNLDLADKRLNRRLIKTAILLGRSPLSPINEACGDWSHAKGAYRLFDNDRVKTQELLKPHQNETVKRMNGHDVVLVAQDTVFFTYGHHPKTTGLGPVVKSAENGGMLGLVMHHALALTPSGLPLGILSQNIFARKEIDTSETMKEKVLRIKYMPTEEKESLKWLLSIRDTAKLAPVGTKVITIADRESDFFELIEEATKLKASFVIRGKWDRQTVAEDSEGCDSLLEALTSAQVAGTMTVDISGNDKRRARTAIVEIRCAAATIRPPARRGRAKMSADYEPLAINVISVTEIDPPKDSNAISWVLLTNLPVRNFSEAVEKVTWYGARWGIEIFHKVMKSGCKVEDCRLETADRLKRFLSLMSIIAFRVMHVTYLARQSPNARCSEVLSEDELQALSIRVNKRPADLTNPPSAYQATRMIASLGGFLGRKGDGQPGVTTMWRGWQRLMEATEMFKIAKKIYNTE